MSPHQILAIAVRVFAIWLTVRLVMIIPYEYAQVTAYYMQTADQVGAGLSRAYYGIAALLVIALLFVLWRFPLTIAKKLMTSSVSEVQESRSPDLWLAMGCALIGLWLLTARVPSLLFDVMQYGDGFIERLPYPGIMLTRYVVEIAIGVWLVFGAKGFRKLFWSARNAGHITPDK
jgi:hypothetical protein